MLRRMRRIGFRALLLRASGVFFAILALLVFARSVSHASTPDGVHVSLLVVAAIAAPFAAYLAFRYPLIFPFGLYVALVPFDNILQLTSGASYVRLVAALAGVAMLARMLLLRRFVKPAVGWYAWAAFVAWAGITLMWTPDLAESQRVYGIVIQNFLMMTVLALYPIREIEYRWLVILMVASGLGAGIYAFAHHSAMFNGRVSLNVGNLVIDPNQFADIIVKTGVSDTAQPGAASQADSISRAVTTCTTRTPGGSGSRVGPVTRTVSAPWRASAAATAWPCLPEE